MPQQVQATTAMKKIPDIHHPFQTNLSGGSSGIDQLPLKTCRKGRGTRGRGTTPEKNKTLPIHLPQQFEGT